MELCLSALVNHLKFSKDTDRDNFMTAEQAKEYGLIDKIFTSR